MRLTIENLHAEIAGKPILQGINLTIKSGEIHALMGPNGSGKSTLANVLMGHPAYRVSAGQIILDDKNILVLEPHERAKLGLFLAFQYPLAINGLTVGKFLKRALELRTSGQGKLNVTDYIKELKDTMNWLEMDQQFINRYLNEGFSGGEKKRMEILQMLMLKPTLSILDEIDSGLDIDALKIVSKGVNRLRAGDFASLIITHYQRILNYIQPDFVHILYQGKIVSSGGAELVETLEQKGYDWIKEQHGIEEESYAPSTSSR